MCLIQLQIARVSRVRTALIVLAITRTLVRRCCRCQAPIKLQVKFFFVEIIIVIVQVMYNNYSHIFHKKRLKSCPDRSQIYYNYYIRKNNRKNRKMAINLTVIYSTNIHQILKIFCVYMAATVLYWQAGSLPPPPHNTPVNSTAVLPHQSMPWVRGRCQRLARMVAGHRR